MTIVGKVESLLGGTHLAMCDTTSQVSSFLQMSPLASQGFPHCPLMQACLGGHW